MSNVANIQASIYQAFGQMELLPWVSLGYSICNIALIPLGRQLFKFGDFKVLNLVSMLFILAGSILSGAAPSIECVIAGRAVMAIGTSIIYQGYSLTSLPNWWSLANNDCSILSFNIIFAHTHELGLVQGIIGACFVIGLLLGPVIGGAFAANEHTTWRWVSRSFI